jgi:hypothetical protein
MSDLPPIDDHRPDEEDNLAGPPETTPPQLLVNGAFQIGEEGWSEA